jgi:hypothetical protein
MGIVVDRACGGRELEAAFVALVEFAVRAAPSGFFIELALRGEKADASGLTT